MCVKYLSKGEEVFEEGVASKVIKLQGCLEHW